MFGADIVDVIELVIVNVDEDVNVESDVAAMFCNIFSFLLK